VGPRQSHQSGFVLPAFARAALREEALEVHGEGTQRRSFAHVGDVVRALIALAECDRAVGQIVNVGTPEEKSIVQVATDIGEHAAARYGRRSRIAFVPWAQVPERPADMDIRLPDTSRLEQLTGIRFSNRWQEIVEDVCAWQARLLQVRSPSVPL
jgi:UDP-glucose 4-epimerase